MHYANSVPEHYYINIILLVNNKEPQQRIEFVSRLFSLFGVDQFQQEERKLVFKSSHPRTDPPTNSVLPLWGTTTKNL